MISTFITGLQSITIPAGSTRWRGDFPHLKRNSLTRMTTVTVNASRLPAQWCHDDVISSRCTSYDADYRMNLILFPHFKISLHLGRSNFNQNHMKTLWKQRFILSALLSAIKLCIYIRAAHTETLVSPVRLPSLICHQSRHSVVC